MTKRVAIVVAGTCVLLLAALGVRDLLRPSAASPEQGAATQNFVAAGTDAVDSCLNVGASPITIGVVESNEYALALPDDARTSAVRTDLAAVTVETTWRAVVSPFSNDQNAGEQLIQVQFVEASMGRPLPEPLQDELLTSPLLVRASRECRFLEFGWPASTTPQAAYLQQAWIARLQAPGPSAGNVGHYRTSVFDSTGRYSAVAEVNDHVHLLQLVALTEAWEGDDSRRVDVTRSLVRVERPSRDVLFDTFESRLDLRHRDGHEEVATSQTTIRSHLIPGPATLPDVPDPDDPSWVWGNLLEQGIEFAPQFEVEEPVVSALVGISVNDAMVRYAEMIESRATPSDYLAFLRAWIRANPDQLDALLALLQGNFFVGLDVARAGVFEALAQAGTPEATALLQTLLRNEEAFSGDRMRAAFALNGMEPAPPGLLDDILNTLDGSMSEMGEDAMMLQAGVFAQTQNEFSPDDAARAREWILDRYQSATPDDVAPVIQAAGNATGDMFADVFAEGLAHSDPSVRVVAARATRGLSPELQVAQVVDALEREDHSAVRAALFETTRLAHGADGRPLPEPVIDAAASELAEVHSEHEYRARVAALAYAAEHGDDGARQTLEAAYDEEANGNPINFDRLRILGQYVRNDSRPVEP